MAVIALCGCRRGSAPGPVRIGSKNFSEQVLLAEIVAQALEGKGLRVDRRLNLGGTFVCHKALLAGDLDVYPEYTGTAFTAILAKKPVSDPAAVLREVESEYAKRWGIVWSPPLGFENTFALVVRDEDARRWNLKTISDLKAHQAEIRPGFGYEFLEREDGFPGLAKTYGLDFPRRPAQMDLGLLYPALQSHQVDLIAGNSTDGLIAALGAVVLEDDRHYFPPYEAAFVVRGQVWKENTAVREILQGLGGKIAADTMRKLNAQLDRDKRGPRRRQGFRVAQFEERPGRAPAGGAVHRPRQQTANPTGGRAQGAWHRAPCQFVGGTGGRRPFPGRSATPSRGGPRRRGCARRRRRGRDPGTCPRPRDTRAPRRPRA
jgi:glycine betaine/choline ABC-type transport system substrate-binding protein